jgi:hypothetical protein
MIDKALHRDVKRLVAQLPATFRFSAIFGNYQGSRGGME